MLTPKTIFTGLFFLLALSFEVAAQKFVVDTTSSNKYLIKRPAAEEVAEVKEEKVSFGDKVLAVGSGILNRLKSRLNLEEANESLKSKKEKLLGKKEDEE